VSRAQRSTSRAFTPVFAGYCDALQTQDRSSLWRSRVCFALHRIRDTNRRSAVAGKPQAAAIRAETLDRELIVTGSARSVGRGAIIRPRGTARAMMGCAAGAARRGWGMRSYRWRSLPTHAAAPAAPRDAIRGSAIRIATTSAPSARSRAALLGSVWLGALVVFGPNAAQATDGTWIGGGAPVSNEWFQGNNWNSTPTPNTVPDITATFTNNGAPTSVTISTSTSINTIDFTAAAPAYSFTVQNGATFTITGGKVSRFETGQA